MNCCMSAVNYSLYLSDVGLPHSVCLTVGMRNIMTENNALAANITLCHRQLPPYIVVDYFNKISKKYFSIKHLELQVFF